KIPIMGMGGVSCAEDVVEMMLAGASAVQIGAANLRNPFVCREIIEELPMLCEKLKIQKLSEITGGAH
ncbi:MAG: dihydroorotate dehydrogenase, partial [Oscillospiraceae bacterium]